MSEFVLLDLDFQIVHCEKLKARAASYGELEIELSQFTEEALGRMGITELYTHQVRRLL